MSRFREQKMRLKALLSENGWLETLEGAITSPESAREALNPLLALLARPELRWQAAYGLGLAVPLMAEEGMENARVVMRRFMWSLNEESGNLGWGIPEAMACILANSPALFREYARIFFSYGYETGKDDNFLDHAPLRRGVFWGMGRIAQKDPAGVLACLPHLCAALGDEDRPIRGLAAWALARLAEGVEKKKDRPENGIRPDGDVRTDVEANAGADVRTDAGADAEMNAGADAWAEAEQALARAMEQERTPEERIELFDGASVIRASMHSLYREAREALAGVSALQKPANL